MEVEADLLSKSRNHRRSAAEVCKSFFSESSGSTFPYVFDQSCVGVHLSSTLYIIFSWRVFLETSRTCTKAEWSGQGEGSPIAE